MPVSLETLDLVLRTHAAERPEKVALRAGDRVWSYPELHSESARVANALLEAGVGPQERVAFLDRNVPEYFTLLFGAAMINGVTLGVNWRLAAPEMEYILNHAQAKVLFIGSEFLGHLAQMNLKTVETVVVMTGDAGEYTAYEDWIAGQSTEDPEVGCAAEDVCYQLYTSGTTGK